MSRNHRGARARILFVAWVAFGLALATAINGFSHQSQAAESPDELLRECSAAALQRPAIKDRLYERKAGLWPRMGFPGEQTIGGALSVNGVPESCETRYARVLKGNVQMLRSGKWRTICLGCGSWQGAQAGIVRFKYAPPHPDAPANAPVYNSCGSKGRFHPVRLWMIAMLTRPATQSVEASKEWVYPIAVRGSCRQAAISAKRVRAFWKRNYGIE